MAKNNSFLDNLLASAEQQQSYKTIMMDGIIDEREIIEQADLVNKLIAEVEKKLDADEFALVSQLISEMNVLSVLYNSQNKF